MRTCTESGFVFFALIALILPLVVLVGSVTSALQGRSDGLLGEIHQEKALMAAESGLDEALFMASQGTLVSGSAFTRDLGDGLAYEVTPVLLKTDGIDNDGDTLVDESDEDVFQLTIDGTYARARRRLAAYLGPLPLMPPPTAAVTVTGVPNEFDFEQDPLVTGIDTNMDGTPGPSPAVPGLSIMDPGTTADLLAKLDAFDQSKITGDTPAPSLGTTPAFDLDNLVLQLQNVANIVLTGDEYDGANLGNGPGGVANIVFRQGDLELENTQGAGILVVTGELEFEDNSRWDGIVIALGNGGDDEVEIENNAHIYGALIMGPNFDELEMDENTTRVRYSSEAIALAMSLMPVGKYVTFNGWQEISLY